MFLKKENTTQKRKNNMNGNCDMAKVRDLKDFYETVTKKNNGKSDDEVPPFLSSASGRNINHQQRDKIIHSTSKEL